MPNLERQKYGRPKAKGHLKSLYSCEAVMGSALTVGRPPIPFPPHINNAELCLQACVTRAWDGIDKTHYAGGLERLNTLVAAD